MKGYSARIKLEDSVNPEEIYKKFQDMIAKIPKDIQV